MSAPRILTVPKSVAVLIPIKAFTDAKSRLEEVLDADSRSELAQQMAATVIAAAAPLPVTVVCDDEEVSIWARSQGAAVIKVDEPGLNRAVNQGVTELASSGYEKIIIAHGDLPRAKNLSQCANFDGITLVPDRHSDGTPIIVIPAQIGFKFSYGSGSFACHVAEAKRLGLKWRTLTNPELRFDVDSPDDLADLKDDN
tara:strand:- start:876 stop:1469 length:594 start_codon:yes stop_codon:yes gene_type:complete